jgi:hypothetical protein
MDASSPTQTGHAELLAERGAAFTQVVVAVEAGGLVDVVAHPSPAKHTNQRVIVVAWDRYAHLVPFVEEADGDFLEAMIPGRKAAPNFPKKADPDAD